MKCIEPNCNNTAGTQWTKHWCEKHDRERRERITQSMEDIAESFNDNLAAKGD